MRRIFLALAALFFSLAVLAQTKGITVPAFNDPYSAYVQSLEAGQTNIDYKAFRASFLESEQFVAANKKTESSGELMKKMKEQVRNKEYDKVIETAQKLLSIDYTSMAAHKLLSQSYKALGDSANAAKYKTIEFGLLQSIVKNGDGKTCATAWPVIQVEEEYFILSMLGASLKRQSTDFDGGQCDRMEVTVDGESRVYYFEISGVFKGYKKLGLP